MYRKLNLTALFVLFMAIAVLVSGSDLQAQTTAGDLVVVKRISKKNRKAALAFWTREAIAAAQPMEMPSQVGPAEVDTAALGQPEVSGPPGFAPAGAAAPGANKVAREAYPQDWAALEAELAPNAPDAPEGTSQVYTAYTVNYPAAFHLIYPHIWIGRMSFTTPAGTSYCSATSISNNIMLTAAHCVYDSTNNAWYSNWVFTPAYRNGAAPYGTFPATSCWVLTDWVNLTGTYAVNTWARHDVAVCNMGTNTAGTTLNNAVGWMGRQWNWPFVRHFHNFGYPFRNYNDVLLGNAGLYLRVCAAESFQQTTETRGAGCVWGKGISGGPWMVGYAPTVITGNADSVNSGLFTGTQNLYGARFNSNNIVVLCNAAGC